MKKCRICNKNKELTEFHKQARNRDGLFHECKECTEQRRRERRRAEPEKTKELNRQHYLRHKQRYITKGRLRAIDLRKAQPKWLTEDHIFTLQEIYDLRDLRSELTGVPHHVDHIVPLRGTNVCGLHVPWNLQVIPAVENRSKGNKH